MALRIRLLETTWNSCGERCRGTACSFLLGGTQPPQGGEEKSAPLGQELLAQDVTFAGPGQPCSGGDGLGETPTNDVAPS